MCEELKDFCDGGQTAQARQTTVRNLDFITIIVCGQESHWRILSDKGY